MQNEIQKKNWEESKKRGLEALKKAQEKSRIYREKKKAQLNPPKLKN